MKNLNSEEMLQVKGGAISIGLAGLITGIAAGLISFAIGVWDGYLHPNACRK